MKSSTAIGTTATADRARYRGRFAPSPTGELHQGSLFAALASWLDARAAGGSWIIRMEDLDTARVVPGAADGILATLERFGMVSDAPILFQSTRAEAYREALARLEADGLVYRCRCSRSDAPGPYPGTCRGLGITAPDTAWRLRFDRCPEIAFEDRVQGRVSFRTADLGDPVILRRDGIAAYQLAVTVDDAFQGITDVVRGADLLDSTAWQLELMHALGLSVPRHAHVPLLTEPDGAKLAKSRRSVPVDPRNPGPTLAATLAPLGLDLPRELKAAPVSDMLAWAVQHWNPKSLAGVRALPLPELR